MLASPSKTSEQSQGWSWIPQPKPRTYEDAHQNEIYVVRVCRESLTTLNLFLSKAS
jgi:hypothetical protein